jgi:uncharacterized membrane protein
MILDRIFIKPERTTLGKEKLSRSFVKSISWRIVGTVDTILISYLITGEIRFALSIGAIELITKMGLYVIHERIWNKTSWGKSK